MSAGQFQQQCLLTVLIISCELGVQLIPFFFYCIRIYEEIISSLLVGVFITLLQDFGFGFELGTKASSWKKI
jgi:hypothetical protein